MSSSYFDAQPAKAQPPAALLDIPEGSDLAKMSLLSPQVSRILDDLELQEKSSSEDESASLSEDSNRDKDASDDRKSRRDLAEQDHGIRKAQTSPLPRGSKQTQAQNQQSHQPGLNSPKHPHLARFHSLRSMLFSSHIEDNIQKCNETKMQEQAEAKWKAEHDLRRGLNRPKTPESQSPSREGLVKRMTGGLKRMASKNSPPPMAKIPEDNVSTASDDEEQDNSNEEDINHSDIEDIVRWVSRRDPPSDGEARKLQDGNASQVSKTDSGHESLGNSDVDELVRWVSRREEPEGKGPHKDSESKPEDVHHRYSDASTQSDSEVETRQTREESMNQDDVDELVRWVSRRDGPNAGPVRNNKAAHDSSSRSEAQDSQAEELARWAFKQDDMSGESLEASKDSLPVMGEHAKDRKSAPIVGSRLKREVSHTKPAAMESETALTHDDVDELVEWVTRKTPNV
ncbi:hypothetical protein N0V90_007577 [Kalmusia sp. IMI 367209]|nr:hypothetical protein N0V90_007577 [Kalmusia sp. IMI 367209]